MPTSIVSQLNVGDVPGGNCVTIEEDGSIELKGDASVWNDLRFPATQTKQGSNLKPDFDQANVGLLFPQNDASEVIYLNAQIPHDYKVGSTIHPHLHYVQTGSLLPVFKMSYRWYNLGEDPTVAFTTLTSNGVVFTYVSGSMHQILSFPTIIGTGKGISSMLDIKIYREDNVVTGDVMVKEFDIHYQIDSIGSRTEMTK